MYSNKCILSILQNGQVLDEKPNGEVLLPLNSEYQIRMRNKNNRKCAVDIYIDGEHVTTAGKVIVDSHSYVDLERYLHSKDSGRKFKFVSLDSAEAKTEGKGTDKAKNGVIECRFYLEKEHKKELIVEKHYHHYDYHSYPVYIEKPIQPWPGTVWCSTVGGTTCSNTLNNASNISYTTNTNSGSIPTMYCYCSSPVAGATVEGSKSYQSFSSSHIDLEEEYTSIKVQLKGSVDKIVLTTTSNTNYINLDKQVEFDFVKKQPFCSNCGTQHKEYDNFCYQCGKKLK